MTVCKANHTRISKAHVHGKNWHATPIVQILICKPYLWGKEIEKREETIPIQPTTKIQVTIEYGQEESLVEAAMQPAITNEFHILELLWAWEPTYREGVGSSGLSKRSLRRVLSRNLGGLIKHNLDFENLFFVERTNRGGGLALYWRNSIDLKVETFSKYHIDAIINKGKVDAWRMTGFYGEPMTQRRTESWSTLHQLNSRFSLPWLCTGDFNELLKSPRNEGETIEAKIKYNFFEM